MDTTSQLIDKANLLGTQSSQQTGVPFKSIPSTNTISTSSLAPSTPLAIPKVNPDTTASAIIGTTQPPAPVDQTTKDINTAKADLAQNLSLKDKILGTIKDKFGIIQTAQENAAKPDPQLEAQQKDLANINTEIANTQVALRSESDAIKTRGDISKEAQGGLIDNLTAKYGRTLADLAIRQSAAQGNITALTTAADRKLALTIAPLQTEISYYKDFVLQNLDQLSEADRNTIDKLVAKNEKEIERQTADKNAKTALLTKAIENGVKLPDSIVSQVTSAPDVATAAAILARNGISLQNPLDVRFKESQIAENEAQVQKIRSEIASLPGVNNPDQTIAYAQQYASTGAIPTGLPKGTFGLVAKVAKELPKPEGTLVDINTGIKSGKLSPAQSDAIVALKDLSQKLTQAETLFKDLNTGIIAGAVKSVFPTDAQQQYDALRSEIVDLLARARTGAAINASEEALYLSKVPGKFNNSAFVGSTGENKLAGLKSSIDGKLDTSLKTNGLAIYGYSKVNIQGQDYTVGDVITNDAGQKGRINPDGTITIIQ